MLTTCPECGGTFSRGYHTFDMHVGRRTVSVSGEYERCIGDCKEVYFAPGEMDAAMIHASDVIRTEEGLLTPSEIKSFRKRIGLTQPQLEDLLGAGLKTVTRWEKGTVIQNGATDTLLRLLRDMPEALSRLMQQRSITPHLVPLIPRTRAVSYQYAAVSESPPVLLRERLVSASKAPDTFADIPINRAELVA